MKVLKFSQEEAKEVVDRCLGCSLFLGVKKERGMNPAITLQTGRCLEHGEVHFLDYSGLNICFDRRECQVFKSK